MKKRRTPQDKKQLRYAKDHVVLAESPHGFRKSWPKKKAHINQAYRHHIRQSLSTAHNAGNVDTIQSDLQAISRKRLHKWGAVSLRERVEYKLVVRRSRLGWNFFRGPYSSAADREPFIAFLEALTAGQAEESVRLARVVAEWLAPANDQLAWLKLEEKRHWLRAFFKDAPEWEVRLRRWVDSLIHNSAKS